MHRLLVETSLLKPTTPELPTEAARHLRVLRPAEGEEVELFDGAGHARVYRYSAARRCLADPDAVTFVPRDASFSLTLFACVTKGARWDWTLEKATELGVTRIVPVLSARTIVRLPQEERPAKRARWRKIVEEAARQSDARWLPELAEPTDFAETLAEVAARRTFVGALTNPPPEGFATVLTRVCRTARDIAVYVGPEGDFTPDELAALVPRATPVSFGPTILRAETAALFAVSAAIAVLRT